MADQRRPRKPREASRKPRGENISNRLLDLILRHRHVLRRWENGRIGELQATIHQARRDLVAQLREAGLGDGTPESERRRLHLEILVGRMGEILEITRAEVEEDLRVALRELADQEYRTMHQILERGLPAAIRPLLAQPLTSGAQLAEILRAPLGGPWEAKLLEHYGGAIGRIREELAQAALLGEGMAKAAVRVAGVIETADIAPDGRSLQTRSIVLARTEIQRVASRAQAESYAANADLIAGDQWTATLDDRTCRVCGALDGRVWFRDGRKPARASAPPQPRHPQCRCTFVPLMRSARAILGDDVTPELEAFMDGGPADVIAYDEWLDSQEAEEQDSILGKQRAERFRNGTPLGRMR